MAFRSRCSPCISPNPATADIRSPGPAACSPAHLCLHSSGALISTYGYREKPYGIRAMLSWDGGNTWDTDYILDASAQSGDLGYPASVELPGGRILTVFYENLGGESVIMQKIWALPTP